MRLCLNVIFLSQVACRLWDYNRHHEGLGLSSRSCGSQSINRNTHKSTRQYLPITLVNKASISDEASRVARLLSGGRVQDDFVIDHFRDGA